MKKVLISLLIVLLVIMAYFAIFKGISIGSFKILSVEQITEENDELTRQITQTELLINNAYPTQTEQLEKSVSDLMKAKDEYNDLASVSTDGELQQANQDEEYTYEFLWTSLGGHATKTGVNISYTLSSGTTGQANIQNINFTISGEYVPIINFITAIEDDSSLGFRIRNFKLQPGGDHLQATFLVTNVKVKQEGVNDISARVEQNGTETATSQSNTKQNEQTDTLTDQSTPQE